MELTLTTFLIVCPLVFLGGFIDSIAGGGGIITLPAYLIAGLPPHYAIATNKLSASLGSTMAAFRMWRNHYINIVFLIPSLIAAMIGANIGSRLLLIVSEVYLQYLLLIILPLTAFYVLRKQNYDDDKVKKLPRSRACVISVLISLVIGAYCGFYGPGAGAFFILLLFSLAGMNIREAAGSAKLINVASNMSALVVFLMSGKVIVALGLVAAAFSILGNYIGSGMLIHRGAVIIRPIIICVLALFFVKIIYELIA